MRLGSIILIIITTVFSFYACYKFDSVSDEVSLTPGLAFPIARVNQNIESSLVLFGNPEINLLEEVPEWAKYKRVYLIDTIQFALADIYAQSENIRYLIFLLSTQNDFPSSAEAQLLFLNESDIAIDSLFLTNAFVVSGSTVSSHGVVLQKGAAQTTMAFNRDRIEGLRQATKLVIRCSASNEGVPPDYFQYYLNYFLRVNVGVRIGLTLQID